VFHSAAGLSPLGARAGFLWEEGGKREEGRGMRDEGSGIRDPGCGMWDVGGGMRAGRSALRVASLELGTKRTELGWVRGRRNQMWRVFGYSEKPTGWRFFVWLCDPGASLVALLILDPTFTP